MRDRADPHARDHAIDIARQDPAPGLSPDAAAAEVQQVLDAIGDVCPGARRNDGGHEMSFLAR
jgi:hypothetical protein